MVPKGSRCAPGCSCGRHNPSPEEVERLRSLCANRVGRKNSEEHRRNQSAALTGRQFSEAHLRKIAEVNADPELLKVKRASRIAQRKPPESHRAVHKRLITDRGTARNQRCVDCSGPANAWTHAWETWEDVAQDRCGKRLTFSTNLDAYEPRCHGCHNTLDRAPRPWHSL